MSLTLEHVRRKSPEKPRRRVKFSNENTKDLQPSARKKVRKLTTKQKLIKQSFELRKKFEELSSEWQEKLFDTVDINVLRESAKYLLPQHYFEIVEERNADNLCGYPICNKDRQEIQGQFRISNQARKIYDISELKCYCSTVCFTSSKFFVTQLSDEPVYMRNLENWKSVNVIPLGVDLREIIKKEKSPTNLLIKEDIKSTYVKDMFATLPPAPPGLVIKEKNDKEIEAPSVPTSTNDANAHDAIEGFRIGFQGLSISDSDSKPTTLILSKDEQVAKNNASKTDEEDYEMAMSLANSMFRNGKFHYQDDEEHQIVSDNMISNSNSIKTIDSIKNYNELVDQPTSIEYKGSRDYLDEYSSKSLQKSNNSQPPLSPEKKARKKKRVMLQMSLFGKIWTALDRMSTPNTRRYFESINGQFVEGNGAIPWRQPITNENALMRIQIFSEKIIECFHLLRKNLAITTGIERELINLMSTFTFDTTTVVFNDLENNVLCMVFLYALSMDITELRENIFPENSSSKKDEEYQFKTILKKMNLTIEELDAFVRVLRIGPV